MIDLHIKTTLSTGQMSVFRTLETIRESNPKYFSIADKNHCLAYNLIDKNEFPNIINGTAINTFFNGRPIDLLGYDVDVAIINEWYDMYYSIEEVELIEKDRTKKIIKMLKSKGFKVDTEYERYNKLGISIKQVFASLLSSYPDFVYKNERDFWLYAINNPNSEYYIDQTIYLPDIPTVIKLIKKAGGKVFLAHPFEYRADVGELLEMVLELNLDGVEVYHASISVLNSLTLIDFCEASDKLASIGSGFVGNEVLIPLGVHLDEEILTKPCFAWIFDR